MGRVFILMSLALGTFCSPAVAASTDYDGDWLFEVNCPASTSLPAYGAFYTRNISTIENGRWTNSRSEYIHGIPVTTHDSGNIQDGNMISTTDSKGGFGLFGWFHFNWSGHAVSATEIIYEGTETKMMETGLIARKWVEVGRCSGKQSLIKPSPISLAGRGQQQNKQSSNPVPAPLPVPVPTPSPRPSPVPTPIPTSSPAPAPAPVPVPAPVPSSTSIACQKFPNLCP